MMPTIRFESDTEFRVRISYVTGHHRADNLQGAYLDHYAAEFNLKRRVVHYTPPVAPF